VRSETALSHAFGSRFHKMEGGDVFDI